MFIELNTIQYLPPSEGCAKVRVRTLIDFQSGQEIHDRGDEPAHWVNHRLGVNHRFIETYEEVRAKLIKAGLLVET